jgi:sorting nexin-4
MGIPFDTRPLQQSVDDFEAMYERVRCPAPMEEVSLGRPNANPTCSEPTNVIPPSSPPSPTSSQPRFDDLIDDPGYDQLSDIADLEEERLCYIRDPTAIRRRAMADDFSEGRLETFVGHPQKELAGTQNQYVSYQVTTKVGTRIYGFTSPHVPEL